MPATAWKPECTTRAQELWGEYLQHHDISNRIGDTAGIDPVSGRIWTGESAEEILAQLEREGLETPLYFVRIGFDYYLRKGGRPVMRRLCESDTTWRSTWKRQN